MAQRGSKLLWTLALFFFSGATSLVYEVLWTRRLSLTFGHTVLAVSTVLTVFMSGLALGSFLAGRWSDKEREKLEQDDRAAGPPRFLALYGKLEIAIGLWAVLSLFLLNGVEGLYLSAAQSGAGSSALYAIVFLGSFAVLLPPTTAMGATLPIFTQLLVATRQDVGAWLSRIYGWNTLGACCGAGIGGFVLLPLFGLKIAVGIAALGNLVIGVVAIQQAGKLKLNRNEEAEQPAEEDESLEQEQRSGLWVLPLAFGLSGFAAMVYQLGWTRGLVLSIGSSTYSFAIILTAFLASLGLGSLIYKRVMHNSTPRVMHLAYLQFAIALTALGATILIGKLPEVMVKAIPALDFQFARILAFDFFLCVGLMLLPTLAMGLTFPLVTHLYTDRLSSLGKRLGEAYAANTLGAIAGSFLGGFVLLPQFGAQNALFGAVVLNLLVGSGLALVGRGSRVVAVGLALAGVIGVAMAPTWDPTKLSAGAAIYAEEDHFIFRPAYYKDGLSATVTVGYNGPHAPYLKVNGKTDASLGIQDMVHQVLLGLLPVSLHPQPEKVALIGLGSGVTSAALVATDSVKEVQCSELEPAVVEVQKEYFAPFTEHVLDNPKLHMTVTDGRTFILGSPQKYDLIISQPSNPWIAGIGNLYTEDFYRACNEQLEPGGLMCQWFQLYLISEYDLNLVLATFYKVFPEGMVFQTGPTDILLVGAQQPVGLELGRLEELWQEEKLTYWSQLIGLLEPRYLLGTYVATRQEVMETLDPASRVGALNTDDKPLLEFQAPRSLYLRSGQAQAFHDSFPQLLPTNFLEDPEAAGMSLLGRIQLDRTEAQGRIVEQALKEQIPWAPLAAALLAQGVGDLANAEGLLRALSPERAGQPAAQILIGDLRRKAEQWDLAILHYENALQAPPGGSRYIVLMKLGECALKLQNFEQALYAFQEASTLTSRPDPHYMLGHTTFMQTQDPEQALIHFEAALQRDSHDHASLSRAALMYAQLGQFERAISYAQRSYQEFPESSINVELLVDLMAQAGRDNEARKFQQELLELRQLEASRIQEQ
ncbi:MAG: fused MFS/spermidine synthase [Vulcanimicrobiota bacterium]